MAAVRGLDTRVMGKQRKHPSARGGSFRSWVSIRQPPCRATGSPPPPAPGTSPRPGGAGPPSAAGSSSPRAGAVWPAASPAPGPASRGRTCPQRRTRHDRAGLGSAGWMAVIHAAGQRLALSQKGAVVCRGRSPAVRAQIQAHGGLPLAFAGTSGGRLTWQLAPRPALCFRAYTAVMANGVWPPVFPPCSHKAAPRAGAPPICAGQKSYSVLCPERDSNPHGRRPARFKLAVSAFHHPGMTRSFPSLSASAHEPIRALSPDSGRVARCCLILLAPEGSSAYDEGVAQQRRGVRGRTCRSGGMTESRRPSTASPRHRGRYPFPVRLPEGALRGAVIPQEERRAAPSDSRGPPERARGRTSGGGGGADDGTVRQTHV